MFKVSILMKHTIAALLITLSLVAVPLNTLTVAAQSQRTLTGLLTVLRGDPQPGSGQAAQTRALLNTASERYSLDITESQADALAGQMVAVTGVPQGDSLQVTAITGSDAPPPPEFSTASVLGAQAYANLLCAFAETAHVQPKPLSYFNGLFGNTFGGLDHYWRQVSYQRMGLTGTRAFGWFTLPEPRFAYLVDENLDGYAEFDLEQALLDCVAAADATVDFRAFSGINLMFNDDLDCCAWGGAAILTLDGLRRFFRVTWMPPWGYENASVLAHEMGHGFGFTHSSSTYEGNPRFPYDSDWDVMSNPMACKVRHAEYGCLPQDTISHNKAEIAVWIPADRRGFVPPGYAQTLTLERINQPTSPTSLLMVKVPMADDYVFYTVEFRQRIAGNYEQNLPADGVIIHEVDRWRQEEARVMDADGNGNPNDGGAVWLPGETFTDAGNEISITVVQISGTQATVNVRNVPPDPYRDGVAVWRPATGTYYLRTATADGAYSGVQSFRFGLNTDIPLMGDWNGDGLSTGGIFRASQGRFILSNSTPTGGTATAHYNFTFGQPGDLPVVGDWDGNGRDGVGVFRPSTGQFLLINELLSAPPDMTLRFGLRGDRPLAGDWDGDGQDSPAVWRPSNSTFYATNGLCKNCTAPLNYSARFGLPSDLPFSGDWDGDGRDGIAVFRPSTRVMYLRQTLSAGPVQQQFAFGLWGDVPVAGHWGAATAPAFMPK